jgi:hypothetical protein
VYKRVLGGSLKDTVKTLRREKTTKMVSVSALTTSSSETWAEQTPGAKFGKCSLPMFKDPEKINWRIDRKLKGDFREFARKYKILVFGDDDYCQFFLKHMTNFHNEVFNNQEL